MGDHWGVWFLAALLVVPIAVTPVAATQAATDGGPSTQTTNDSATAAQTDNATTTVTTDPGGTVSVQRWETVTVTVRAKATNVTGYQSAVSYDPSVLQVQTLSGTEDFADPVATVDNANGSVVFNQIRSGETTDPALVELSVQVIGTDGQRGDLSVRTQETRFSNATGATFDPDSSNGVTIAVQPGENGTDGAESPGQSGLGLGGPAVLLGALAAVGWLMLRSRRQP
ncbi:cohesin domain-containing protein [Haloarcula salinisoli]|uniref:Cohesin domain-containing protein n=1 Tax=Haloarcula salinisoli TaxID=2487746 RepID=A0A8J7YGI4_9EURY|nr:cohesin domain-containing protein [Halomicroarcula salinisoli]MBX0285615.1 cohesin domain-containing protein [Halomicroarcula salinisoli]MBX0302896.1 cohesin domain-containing protein [Halomicroarcula salinisoli]